MQKRKYFFEKQIESFMQWWTNEKEKYQKKKQKYEETLNDCQKEYDELCDAIEALAVIEDTTDNQVHGLINSLNELKRNDDKIKMSKFEQNFINYSKGIKIFNTSSYEKFEICYKKDKTIKKIKDLDYKTFRGNFI